MKVPSQRRENNEISFIHPVLSHRLTKKPEFYSAIDQTFKRYKDTDTINVELSVTFIASRSSLL